MRLETETETDIHRRHGFLESREREVCRRSEMVRLGWRGEKSWLSILEEVRFCSLFSECAGALLAVSPRATCSGSHFSGSSREFLG